MKNNRLGPSSFLRQVLAALAGRRSPVVAALAVLGIGGLAALPLWAHGGFLLTRGGGDSPFLLLRLHQLLAALAGGEFPARWMPDAALGFGFPFFNYYASLPFYLAALLRAYGFSYVAALKLTQTAALALGALGMYAWARRLPTGGAPGGLTRPAAGLAAAAYTFAPFHLANLYVRGDSLSELWAMGLFPCLLWAAQACLARPSLGRALALGGLAGLLTLTHNISALNFMPFVGLALLAAAVPALVRRAGSAGAARSGALQRLAGCGAGLAWGLALAAFFWVPALGEIGAVQPRDLTAGFFFYGNHFRAADLVQPTLFYAAEAAPGQPTPFAMGLAQTALAALGLAALLWRAWRARRWTSGDTFVLLGLALSTYMITPASAWAWERLPLLPFTQFPWRFLSIQALFTAALTAHLVPGTPHNGRFLGWARWATPYSAAPTPGPSPAAKTQGRGAPLAVAVGLSLALALFGLGGLRPEFIPLDDSDVTVERLQVMEYFTGNLGSTIGYEYLPRAVNPRPFASDELLGRAPTIRVVSGAAEGTRQWQRGAREAWTITAHEGPARVALPIYFWPGWRVMVDGHLVEAAALEGLGWITFTVEPGTHAVDLRLGRTPLRAGAEALSLAALLAAAALLVRDRRRRNAALPRLPRWVGIAAIALVVGAAGLRLWPQPPPNRLPVSMDFVQLAYPHRDEVRFAGGARLTAIEYSAQRVARGDSLRITSAWANAVGHAVTLSLAPGSNLLSQAPAHLSTATAVVGPDGRAGHELAIPTGIPPGVYFVTVEAAGAEGLLAALTRQGRERGLVHLGPIWVDDFEAMPAGGAALAAFGPAITLRSAEAAGAEPGVVEVRLVWDAHHTIAANYQIALRLRDAAGFEWGGLDAQLAYGFYPAFMWRAGEAVPDFYRLSTPPGTPPGNYTVDLNVYNPVDGVSLGTAIFEARVQAYSSRAGRATQHSLTHALAVGAVTLPPRFNQGEAPEFWAEWLTRGQPHRDYRARWTLIGPDGARVAQTLDLTAGAHTSQWPANAFLLGKARFGTEATLPPGLYTVSLRLVDVAGAFASPEVTVGEVEVLGRARSYTVPPLERPVGAVFGDALTLHGFNATRTGGALRLDLVWGARAAPGRDYKFFVHLYNEADGFVAQQVDAVPQDFTYPTVLWTAGEVVTDTVRFDLGALPPGMYGIAVGWYDPNTPGLERLTAFDAAGLRLDDDRVIIVSGLDAP